MKLKALIIYVCVCVFAATACSPGEPAGPKLSAEDIALNNRGVALMGQFDYIGAHAVFESLVARQPDWSDAKINLAIATLNRQAEGDEQSALDLAAEVIRDHPDHLRAHYVSGLLRLYLGETETARSHFQQVFAGDGSDAYAIYYLGQTELQLGEIDKAAAAYRKALEINPYLRSAYYSSALALRRIGEGDEAREMLAAYERFKDNPRARLAEFKYTRMGPKAEALAVDLDPVSLPEDPEGELFTEAEPAGTAAAGAGTSLTTADIDSDGRQDLFVSGGSVPTTVLLREDDRFQAVGNHFLDDIDAVNAALWGDYDNDGRIDVYLCRTGPNRLIRQLEGGAWEDVTDRTDTADGEKTCVDGAVFDADHDGDLDYFLVNSDGPSELLNNNRDGTFRALAESQGLEGRSAPAIQVLTSDIDSDRDVDIVVLRSEGPHEIYLNDRLWTYRPVSDSEEFLQSDIVAAVAGDVDADGRTEIFVAAGSGELAVWQYQNGGLLNLATSSGYGSVRSIELKDFNGDGRAEMLVSGDDGFTVLAIDDSFGFSVLFTVDGRFSSVLSVAEQPERGPSVIALAAPGDDVYLQRWAPGPGRYPFAGFELSGMVDKGQSMRSNASGIGTRVALRNGSHWTLTDTFDHHSGPGQSLQPLLLGLVGADRADYIALYWSDGVFQTELSLAAGELHRITETQRQLSSCPVLFAWGGNSFDFVSDILGVGGLGFFATPGRYNTPRPWEYFLLDADQLSARGGRYLLKITEPMEENAYIDSVGLQVIDVPPGWSVMLDERMATGAPEVTGQPMFYRYAVPLSRAINDRGNTVTESLLSADYAAAPTGELDLRFIGRLREPHVLTLEFEQPLDSTNGTPVLLADGWVEYPYSQTVFAAWQAGAKYQPASLEAERPDGTWQMIYPQFGYPAGMPRQMALPMRDLPAGTRRLRLTTNLEVYWDRIRVVFAEQPENVRVREASLVAARLKKTGFPERTTYAQRRPDFDYDRRSPYWDTKYLAGYYTAFGPVTELVEQEDDALAIVGPGEEIHLEFEAVAEPAEAGWNRYFVLEARGYAKDMDLYTGDGETVGPLPVKVSSDKVRASRREALHRKYNNRFQAGH